MAGVLPSSGGSSYSLDDLNIVENLKWDREDYAGFSEQLSSKQMDAITRVFEELGLPAQFRRDDDNKPRIEVPMLGAEELKEKIQELRNKIKP
jgi:hypothetical protein